jgi:hypothetical protein
MSQGTGGYGGASMATPVALFAICFPEITIGLVLIGLVIVFVVFIVSNRRTP